MPEVSAETLKALVRDVVGNVTAVRHRLHRMPEASFAEKETQALVLAELERVGLPGRAVADTTGVLADLAGNRPGGTVALRADMDALPIQERTGRPYASCTPGFSHACGHDGHTACLLGAATVLARIGGSLAGHVRFIFQPAEERTGGAKSLLKAGIFRDCRPDAVFALHAWPGMPAGVVGARSGTMTASSDKFVITVNGVGGHGARPHLARNPLSALAGLIMAFEKLQDDRRVISPCVAKCGSRANVIDDKGSLSGTIRAVDSEARQQAHAELRNTVNEVCAATGTTADVEIVPGCPQVQNDNDLFVLFDDAARHLLGPDNVHHLDAPSMGSEDFGFYLEECPGLLFRLGMGTDSPRLHTPEFDFNDDALETGILMLVALALRVTETAP